MPASSNPPAWDGVDFRLDLGDSEDKLCQVVAYAVQLETYLAQARQSQEPATALAGKRGRNRPAKPNQRRTVKAAIKTRQALHVSKHVESL